MSRGTSKIRIVDAVLKGLQQPGGLPDSYVIAESLVRHAQPCRIDVTLADVSGGRGRKDGISREVRVLGVAGGLRATVCTASDTKRAAVLDGIRSLRDAMRRRAEGATYRMLALRLNGSGFDLDALHAAVDEHLTVRGRTVEVFTGHDFEQEGRSLLPAVVVVSGPPA